MAKKSVYLSEEYKTALIQSGSKIIHLSGSFFAIPKKIKFPVFGKANILEARGTPSSEGLKRFKEESQKYLYGTIAATLLEASQELFARNRFYKVANHTVLINLKKTQEELWNALEKKSARWGVKVAERNNLSFGQAKTKQEISLFYGIYTNTAKLGGFSAHSQNFLEILSDSPVSKLFLVKHKGEIVAGALVLIDKPHSYTILDLTASNDLGQELQAMPFLYWNLLLYAKGERMNYFDLGGYDSDAKEGSKMYNINKFKERFGGQVTEQPIYSTNRIYPIMRSFLKKMQFLKKIYRKEQ